MKKKPAICTIEAPCKINLHLCIGDRRPDGFHTIESLFASLVLSDRLRFQLRGEGVFLSTNMETGEEEIPEDKNLIIKAISLFREITGFREGLNIHLYKRIPLGAGLGGGSSDAAATILALNLLSRAGLPAPELQAMAAILGSDVPFFLEGGTAYVSGRGELVEPVKPPQGMWVVLVKPPFSSGTALAYSLLDRARKQRASGERREALSKETLIRALEGESILWPFYNDFLPVFLCAGEEKPEPESTSRAKTYKAILDLLRDCGASFAGLSGSGSCCFGIFGSKGRAEKAVERFSENGNFAGLTFFLARRTDPVLE